MLSERNLIYTKKNPNVVASQKYLEELIKRKKATKAYNDLWIFH